MNRSRRLLSSLLLVLACDPVEDEPTVDPVAGPDGVPVAGTCTPRDTDSDPFADCLESIVTGGDASFGHDALPDIVLGPPSGGTATMGSMDVASLGCGGSITLAFDGEGIVDVPGPDFIVFENAFEVGGESFAEPGQVLVSRDGVDWYAFECDAAAGWPAPGCAGVTPTRASTQDAATDPDEAGGDAFDLAELGLAHVQWVRIVDRTRDLYEVDTWCAGASGGFDLDAIAAVGSR